jgi:hypothetical protein
MGMKADNLLLQMPERGADIFFAEYVSMVVDDAQT